MEHLTRKEIRQRMREARKNARLQRKMARLSKRQAKKLSKIYGDIDPEEANQINAVQPMTGGMNDQLQEQGVQVNDPEDPIEVTTTYNREVLGDTSIPDEEYYDAYVAPQSDFESYEHAEEARKKAKRTIKTLFGTAAAFLQAAVGNAKDKQRMGESLTDADRAVLAIDTARGDVVGEAKKAEIGKITKGIAPVLIIILIAVIIFKS